MFSNRVHNDDLKDIWAYRRAIPPVKRRNRGNTPPFPFDVRFAQHGWKLLFAHWPLLHNPDNSKYLGAHAVSDPWRIPALNTLLLLSSGATITWAHWGLVHERRRVLVIGLALTIVPGASFLALQASEYHRAYTSDGLTLNAGAYGSTFFLLTGFHGIHVTVGTIMLVVILGRSIAGHFTPASHFGFLGVACYWHFVDVVWLMLFVYVYWL